MSLGLLFPAALAALAALLVPLIIHVARRSEQHPTDFAALRWLRQRPRPRARIRLDEWPLLTLRLALLALAALWLAQPVLLGAGEQRPYVAVIPGARVDRAAPSDARAHWLAPDFPEIDGPPPSGPQPVASLIRQLDADLAPDTPLTIVTPTIIEGADAGRLRLSRKVTWRIQPGAMPPTAPQRAASPGLAVRSDAAHAESIRYLRAAAIAWRKPGHPPAFESGPATAPLPSIDRTLFWMVAGSLPQSLIRWIERGGQAVVPSDASLPEGMDSYPVWHDADGGTLAEEARIGSGRLLRLTRPLVPAQVPLLLDADFPRQLAAILTPVPEPQRVSAADYAPADGARAYTPRPVPLRPWLGLLIALLLCAERWLATSRRRSMAP
jgi:hypothetical protein